MCGSLVFLFNFVTFDWSLILSFSHIYLEYAYVYQLVMTILFFYDTVVVDMGSLVFFLKPALDLLSLDEYQLVIQLR